MSELMKNESKETNNKNMKEKIQFIGNVVFF